MHLQIIAGFWFVTGSHSSRSAAVHFDSLPNKHRNESCAKRYATTGVENVGSKSDMLDLRPSDSSAVTQHADSWSVDQNVRGNAADGRVSFVHSQPSELQSYCLDNCPRPVPC